MAKEETITVEGKVYEVAVEILDDGFHSRAIEPPDSLTDADIQAALGVAEARLRSEFPANAVYGTLFRVAPLLVMSPALMSLICKGLFACIRSRRPILSRFPLFTLKKVVPLSKWPEYTRM